MLDSMKITPIKYQYYEIQKINWSLEKSTHFTHCSHREQVKALGMGNVALGVGNVALGMGGMLPAVILCACAANRFPSHLPSGLAHKRTTSSSTDDSVLSGKQQQLLSKSMMSCVS